MNLFSNSSSTINFLEIRDNDNWQDWIYYILHGIEVTANQTTILIRRMKDLLDYTIDRIRTELPSVYSKDLVETIFEQPYCRVASMVEKGLEVFMIY